jgi:hypothetical protein
MNLELTMRQENKKWLDEFLNIKFGDIREENLGDVKCFSYEDLCNNIDKYTDSYSGNNEHYSFGVDLFLGLDEGCQEPRKLGKLIIYHSDTLAMGFELQNWIGLDVEKRTQFLSHFVHFDSVIEPQAKTRIEASILAWEIDKLTSPYELYIYLQAHKWEISNNKLIQLLKKASEYNFDLKNYTIHNNGFHQIMNSALTNSKKDPKLMIKLNKFMEKNYAVLYNSHRKLFENIKKENYEIAYKLLSEQISYEKALKMGKQKEDAFVDYLAAKEYGENHAYEKLFKELNTNLGKLFSGELKQKIVYNHLNEIDFFSDLRSILQDVYNYIEWLIETRFDNKKMLKMLGKLKKLIEPETSEVLMASCDPNSPNYDFVTELILKKDKNFPNVCPFEDAMLEKINGYIKRIENVQIGEITTIPSKEKIQVKRYQEKNNCDDKN